jgi:putative endonuclease
MIEHWLERGNQDTFTGKYHCYNLVYYEEFTYILNAIAREKEIKGWRRQKKVDLIQSTNPTWAFLNKEFCGEWPPKDAAKRSG